MCTLKTYQNLRTPSGVAAILVLLGACAQVVAASPPNLAEVKKIVAQHLRSQEDYAPGDLISRGDVEAIFNELLKRGFTQDDITEDLFDDFVPDNSLLVRSLRTKAGRKFMRQVSSLPGAYDRLERLSWIPAGKEILRDLIEKPDGVQVFKKMLEPAGMEATARYLASDPRGKNYALPTGHVHTVAQLMKRLEERMAGPTGQK